MVEMAGTIETTDANDEEYKPYFSGEEDDDENDNDDDDEEFDVSRSMDFKPPLARRKSRGRPRKHFINPAAGPKRPRGRPRKIPIIGKSFSFCQCSKFTGVFFLFCTG